MNDHCVFKAHDGNYHLIGITSFEGGATNERYFVHGETPSINEEMKERPTRVVDRGTLAWAPCVVRTEDDYYYMFYGPSPTSLSVSFELHEWYNHTVVLNNEPLFYTTGWSYHRWPCYFYVSTLLCYLLHIIYVSISKISFVDRAIKFLAKCSYEIFLVQMAVIALLPKFGFIGNKYLALSFWIIVVWISSLVGGYVFNRVYSSIFKRIR